MTRTTTAETRLVRAYHSMARADLDDLMDLYAPDAIIQGAGEAPVVGIEAIRAFWQSMFQQYRVELTPEILEETSLGDAVVVRGRATGAFVAKDGGETTPVDAWFLQVYQRGRDGKLLFWRGANGPSVPPDSRSIGPAR